MDTRHTVANLLRGFDTAMMVTHGRSGPLDARPMHVAAIELEEGGPIWFMTSIESHTAMELAADARTLLVFQEPGRYLAVWGQAGVVDDRPRIARLWRDELLAWFPTGPGDPDLRLVEFTPHSAEVWQRTGSANGRYTFEPVAAHARTNL
jgi:general stress protein 26